MAFVRSGRRLLTAAPIPLLAVTALLACQTEREVPSPVEQVEHHQDELGVPGTERAIPLRFIKMYDEAPPDAIDEADMYAGVRELVDVANNVFKPAGVQFYIRAMVDCSNSPGFQFRYADLRTPVSTYPNGEQIVSFATAKADLACPYPAIASRTDPGLGSRGERYWTDWATMEYASESEVIVWLHKYADVNNGILPWAGRGIHIVAQELDDITLASQRKWLLAHELGHTLGLSHSWDMQAACVTPGKVNPASGVGFRMSDFWDMAFKPGTSSANPHVFFNDRATAAVQEDAGSSLLAVHGMCYSYGAWTNKCSFQSVPDDVHCDVGQCFGSYWETYDSPPAQQLKGLAFDFPTGVGVNVMSFLNDGRDFEQGLSASQARVVRSYLRHETTQDEIYSGHLGSQHGRTRLGTYVHRDPAVELDFNGDLKRDIAWWVPPTAAESYGRFYVRLSPSYGTTTEIAFAGSKAGDIPVPADYDGDGRTNLALYRPGGGPNGDAPWDLRSYWLRCPSPSTLDTFTCWWNVTSVQFGDRQDVPLPGLDFDANPATAHFAVYRPVTDGRFIWAPVTNPAATTSVSMGNELSVPLAGLVDDDNQTDVVIYQPGNAYFLMALSSLSYAMDESSFRLFPTSLIGSAPGTAETRSAGVVVRGVVAHRFAGRYLLGSPIYEPRMALSMFSPFDGNWYVNWTPVTSTSPSAACQWGTYRDLPLGGIGSSRFATAAPGYSKLAVFRSDNSVAGADAKLAFRSSICGSSLPSRYPSSGTSRSMVFSVRDMTGDNLPEIVVVDPDDSTAQFLTSDSDYVNSTYGGSSIPSVQLGNQRATFL